MMSGLRPSQLRAVIARQDFGTSSFVGLSCVGGWVDEFIGQCCADPKERQRVAKYSSVELHHHERGAIHRREAEDDAAGRGARGVQESVRFGAQLARSGARFLICVCACPYESLGV